MATICWASTSSGLRGITVVSIRPSRMRLATTAHSRRSARNLGKIRPLETSPTLWPARPMRCRPGGDRLGRLHLQHQVHGAHVDAQLQRGGGHQAGQLARLEQVLHHQPLLAREGAVVGAGDRGRRLAVARQLVQPQRQALGAAAVVHEDDRGAVLLDQRQQLGVDGRPDRAPGGARVALHVRELGVGIRLAHVLHRHVDLQVQRLAHAGVHHPALAPAAHQEAARPRPAGSGWPTGRCAARGARSCAPGARGVRARCAPRLVRATAWISSTITASTPSRISRACEVSIRYSDSGVVISTSGGWRSIAARSFCGVSPVRMATRDPSPPIPLSGARRFFSTS